jgi:hypothetical protein
MKSLGGREGLGKSGSALALIVRYQLKGPVRPLGTFPEADKSRPRNSNPSRETRVRDRIADQLNSCSGFASRRRVNWKAKGREAKGREARGKARGPYFQFRSDARPRSSAAFAWHSSWRGGRGGDFPTLIAVRDGVGGEMGNPLLADATREEGRRGWALILGSFWTDRELGGECPVASKMPSSASRAIVM